MTPIERKHKITRQMIAIALSRSKHYADRKGKAEKKWKAMGQK